MEVIFHVRNFGKIKSADVNISNFALFVGNNNSGKTLLMELIYAVLDDLSFISYLEEKSLSFLQQGEFTFRIGKEELIKLNQYINEYLHDSRQDIIRDYFNSNNLTVDEISIEFADIDDAEYQIAVISRKSILTFAKSVLGDNDAELNPMYRKLVEQFRSNPEMTVCIVFSGEDLHDSWLFVEEEKTIEENVAMSLIRCVLGIDMNEVMFLPAARTGFMMTYRPYFSKNSAQKGVTIPVHNFLSFLQDYAYTAKNEDKNESILSFIYENMIDGKIEEVGDSTYYVPKGTNNYVPLMLASSMVNELVPITKMLTNYEPYGFLFYDEVETSMHPSKQMEMVRLLNRLNNSGMKMIVSTHSDAMARKINNMLLLQHADRPFEEIQSALKKKGISLEKEDLLKGDIHVYQFTNGDDGMSTVEELEFREMPLTGYDFPQFMDSSLNLYEEAKTVMGLD